MAEDLAPPGVLQNSQFFRLYFYEHNRKNWLFSGSPKGATASAAVYSLIETPKANGLNPYSYLEFLLQDLPGLPFKQYPQILEDYLPWNSQIQTRCKKNKD